MYIGNFSRSLKVIFWVIVNKVRKLNVIECIFRFKTLTMNSIFSFRKMILVAETVLIRNVKSLKKYPPQLPLS